MNVFKWAIGLWKLVFMNVLLCVFWQLIPVKLRFGTIGCAAQCLIITGLIHTEEIILVRDINIYMFFNS